MRLSRYYQQEQLTDKSSSIFQPRSFTSLLETIGEGLGNIFERTVQQDQQAYVASESAKALAKISEVADGIDQEINAGEILDKNALDAALKIRVDSAFDEMQLQPNIRRMIQPELTQHLSTYGIKLNHSLNAKRGEIEVANFNTALDSIKRVAIEATTTAELTQAIDTIRKMVDGVEGTFLTPQQKQKYLESTMDFIHSARLDRMLQNPAISPETVKEYLQVKKAEITPELFEKLNSAVEDRIQTANKNETLYSLMDQIDSASNFDSVRKSINEHRKEFSPETIRSLQGMVNQAENRKKAETAQFQAEQGELVINQVEWALAVENNPVAATAILQKNLGNLDRNDSEDARLKIELFKKKQVDQKKQINLETNVQFFQNRIDSGEFDSITPESMRDQIFKEIEIGKNLPGESMPVLMNSFFNRLEQVGKSKITLQGAIEKSKAGLYLDQKETDLVYANRPERDPNDPDWMKKEVIFAANTAKNVPSAWKDYTTSACRLAPTADNMQSVDTAAQYVVELSKQSPMVSGTLDKDTLRLLPAYWDRAGRTSLPADKKAEVWKNILQTNNAQNKEMIDRIASGTSWADAVDSYWKQAWTWYGKFAPDQANTQAEYFRDEPDLPLELKLQFEKSIKEQLQATTGEDGMPNYNRAAEYAYHQLFQDWGLTETYGDVRWQYKPLDRFLRKTGLSTDYVEEFIDQEINQGLSKNVLHLKSSADPVTGSLFSFENPLMDIIESSRISLEYSPNSEKNNPESSFPDYLILIDNEPQPAEGGWFGIKGDDLYQFLKNKNKIETEKRVERSNRDRESLNREMELLQNGLSNLPEQIIVPD